MTREQKRELYRALVWGEWRGLDVLGSGKGASLTPSDRDQPDFEILDLNFDSFNYKQWKWKWNAYLQDIVRTLHDAEKRHAERHEPLVFPPLRAARVTPTWVKGAK